MLSATQTDLLRSSPFHPSPLTFVQHRTKSTLETTFRAAAGYCVVPAADSLASSQAKGTVNKGSSSRYMRPCHPSWHESEHTRRKDKNAAIAASFSRLCFVCWVCALRNARFIRHLLKRIEEPMKQFESNQNVLAGKDAKRIIKVTISRDYQGNSLARSSR